MKLMKFKFKQLKPFIFALILEILAFSLYFSWYLTRHDFAYMNMKGLEQSLLPLQFVFFFQIGTMILFHFLYTKKYARTDDLLPVSKKDLFQWKVVLLIVNACITFLLALFLTNAVVLASNVFSENRFMPYGIISLVQIYWKNNIDYIHFIFQPQIFLLTIFIIGQYLVFRKDFCKKNGSKLILIPYGVVSFMLLFTVTGMAAHVVFYISMICYVGYMINDVILIIKSLNNK